MNYFRDDHDSPVPEEPIVNENFIEVASEDQIYNYNYSECCVPCISHHWEVLEAV